MEHVSASWSHRPTKHVERDAIVTWLHQHRARLHANPALKALDEGFRAVGDRYVAAVAANDAAGVDATLAQRAHAEAERAFDAAFRLWLGVAEAHAGSLSKVLTPVLGDRPPHKFLKLGLAPKVYLLDDLFAHVRELPELQVDPASCDRLQSAGDALARAKAATDRALEARASDVRGLTSATAAFDRLYGGLVKAVLLLDPTLGADLPRFRRTRTRERELPIAAK